MTTEFNLPELGEDIDAGDVVALLVSVGDIIEVDQPVLEIETDKAALEIPSSVSACGKYRRSIGSACQSRSFSTKGHEEPRRGCLSTNRHECSLMG